MVSLRRGVLPSLAIGLTAAVLAWFVPGRGDGRIAEAAELVEPAPPRVPSGVPVPEEVRGLALDLPQPVRDALRKGDWNAAREGLLAMDHASLVGSQRADHAFLLAYTGVRTGHAAELGWLLPEIDAAPTPPAAYKAEVRAEVWRATERPLDALAALDEVPDDAAIAARAAADRAEILHDLGRTAESSAIYEAMAARPDPQPGTAFALLSLARRHGIGSDESYALLRRLWSWYPDTGEAAEAGRLLADRYPDRKATIDEAARRAARKVDLGAYGDALTLTAPFVARSADGTPGGCLVAYVRGRAYYRLNELSNAVAAIGDAGRKCAGVEGGEGARALYVAGQALFRKKDHAASGSVFVQIPDLYPEASVADDGLTHAGIARFELGDVPGAMALWRRALDEFPEGDTVPEATFRLAFALYDRGDAEAAREVALRLATLSPGADEVHVAAGAYWAARWLAYPDVHAPDRLNEDEVAVRQAEDEWAAIVEHQPWGWYGSLAWSRLRELAPDRATALAHPCAGGDVDEGWLVRPESLAEGPFARGAALARLGLLREALAEWDRADVDTLTGPEMAWLTELRVENGDWLSAHDRMHRWLHAHPLGTHDGAEPAIVRVAYPDRYWDEVQAAASGFSYPARMLHALVREESMFNKDIVSFAGAKGLAQLMPATAATVAKSLGLSRYNLANPAENVRLGARYLDDVLRSLGGDPALALAGYNAGPGNVAKWIAERGNLPVDEFVERIPFRETRGYVKRVTSTWQVMVHGLDAEGPGFVDLSRFNHHVRPDLARSATPAGDVVKAGP
jgi:soluble lytic murein transglycosylase